MIHLSDATNYDQQVPPYYLSYSVGVRDYMVVSFILLQDDSPNMTPEAVVIKPKNSPPIYKTHKQINVSFQNVGRKSITPLFYFKFVFKLKMLSS